MSDQNTDAAPLIRLAGVGLACGERAALRTIDLAVPARQFVAIVGESGSGLPASHGGGEHRGHPRAVADPRRAILSYDAIVLLAPSRANDALLARAFRPLIDAVPVELMREASLRVDRDKDKEPPAAAARWLAEQILRSDGSPP